jgi:hypothetical protein
LKENSEALVFWTGVWCDHFLYVLVPFVLWFARKTIDILNFERIQKIRATAFVIPFVQKFSDLEFKKGAARI